jgi:hypothetical protein
VGLRIPETNGLVAGGRGQQFAVGAERHPPDGVSMPTQDGDRCA